jgi:hypothetical protein
MKPLGCGAFRISEVDAYYQERGLFQETFGFGTSPP